MRPIRFPESRLTGATVAFTKRNGWGVGVLLCQSFHRRGEGAAVSGCSPDPPSRRRPEANPLGPRST
jgi:hypothetical protein